MPIRGVRMTTAEITAEMGQRVSLWLRRAYPSAGAKRIARDLDASPHTARRWLEGALPENRHLAAMASRWGRRFLAWVYEPAIGPAADFALDDELQELRRRLARLETDYAIARETLRGEDRAGDAVAASAVRPLSPVARGRLAGPGAAVARQDAA